jgi:hypothetical protein
MLALTSLALAQKTEPVTEARVRTMLRAAEAEAKEPSAIVTGLDRRFREVWGDFESFPSSILRRDEIIIILKTPFIAFRNGVADRLRYFQPIVNVPWVDAAVISIEPLRVDAPDIVSVRVQRDGKEIPATKNLLRPMRFTNGLGQAAEPNAGEIQFPMSAFAPGSSVTITFTPKTGNPIVHTLEDADLRMLR